MLNFFRAISFFEGLSYLAILGVSFGFISRDYVSSLGMGHGILFICYMFVCMAVANKEGWPSKVSFAIFIASLVPFAFIPVELFLKKGMQDKALVPVAE